MKHELLAPAGNLQVFLAVIHAGADAVYVGGPKFGARAYAKNFTQEELLWAISYAHLHHVKVYMTVNTLIKNEELSSCVKMMIPFYKAGLDGVIIQDIGVLKRFREEFPEMELHASTQMSISDSYGVNLLKEAGVCRVVLSRELSLKEIKSIKQETNMELECFIHGALCYCYSGQCLLSSVIGGRSGNRGRCAQPCRLPYEVYDQSMQKIREASEILSLKDLCTIEFLPQLLEAGIDSLKIEGRMKQADYAYTVVKLYRKYLDMYDMYGKENYHVSADDYDILLQAGNRDGFTKGYYHQHHHPDMITRHGSSHNSNPMAIGDNPLKPQTVAISGKAQLYINQPAKLMLNYNGVEIIKEYGMVQKAQKAAMELSRIKKQIEKTGESFYTFSDLDVEMDSDIFISVSELNHLRRMALDQLTAKLCQYRDYKDDKDDKADMADKDPTSHPKETSSDGTDIRITASVCKESQAKILCTKEYITRIYVEAASLLQSKDTSLLATIRSNKKEIYIALPYVIRQKDENDLHALLCDVNDRGLMQGMLVRSYDGISFARQFSLPLVADAPVYTYSDIAHETAISFGVTEDTVPYELSKHELYHRRNQESEMLIYGRIPLMVSSGCICNNTIGCRKKENILILKDRKEYQFPVKNECSVCYNVIYNSLPTCLFTKPISFEDMQISHFRLAFTMEEDKDVKQVCTLLEQNILKYHVSGEPLQDFTWGHFHRGVE